MPSHPNRLQRMVTQRPANPKLADHAATSHEAAFGFHPLDFRGISWPVVAGESALAAGLQDDGPRVANIRRVEAQPRSRPVCQHHGGCAAASPGSQKLQLLIHTAKSPGEHLAHHLIGHGLPRHPRDVEELVENQAVELRLAEVHGLAPAVPIVDSEVAPELSILLCKERVDDHGAVLHVRPEGSVRFRSRPAKARCSSRHVSKCLRPLATGRRRLVEPLQSCGTLLQAAAAALACGPAGRGVFGGSGALACRGTRLPSSQGLHGLVFSLARPR
mmetsp:Transcript_56836/g.117435  ORF Transcript_56836/g.117435 Transcript_56836/m.117435 type:complete len:274 (+) Transcript_56836:358-1179(+)